MGQDIGIWKPGACIKFKDKQGLIWTAQITSFDEKNSLIYFIDLRGTNRIKALSEIVDAHEVRNDAD